MRNKPHKGVISTRVKTPQADPGTVSQRLRCGILEKILSANAGDDLPVAQGVIETKASDDARLGKEELLTRKRSSRRN